MKKAFLLIGGFCALCSGAPANAAAPSTAGQSDFAGKTFEALIADAKKTMMSDPASALKSARAAEALARRTPDASPDELPTSLWLEGEASTRINQIADAKLIIERALRLAGSEPTGLRGNIELSLARIADAEGDIALALKSYHSAYDIFVHVGDARHQAITLQGLGSIYGDAHDFQRESEYYNRAFQAYPQDDALELSAKNNLGFAFQQLGRLDEAIQNYSRALQISRTLKSEFLEANILTNLSYVYAKLHRYSDAERTANQALRLLGQKDEEGGAPFVWGVKAQIELDRGNLGAAKADIDQAFHGLDLTKTIAPFRDMHEIAYQIYKAEGDFPSAFAHLLAFKRLDDEGRSLTATANLALVGAQFDFATQQLEIEHLRSEQLKRDLALRETRSAEQVAIFIAVTLACLSLLAWICWRHLLVRRHRNAITKANIALTETLAERDVEIERRIATELELLEAKKVAEQANVAKSHFLANMSHELRTPLNAIIGFADIMSSGALGASKVDKYKEYSTDILASGRNLLAILSDILDMARLDAGLVTLVEEDVCLGSLVENVVGEFRGECTPGKTIRCEGTDPGLHVRGDTGKLRQILVNLLSNAVKFSKEKGRIDVRIAHVEDGVDLIVADDGIGIPEDKLVAVLQAFGQAEDAYARSHGGIGLGLPIVRSLIEMHGGWFALESQWEIGTTARVHLPLDRVLPASLAEPALAS